MKLTEQKLREINRSEIKSLNEKIPASIGTREETAIPSVIDGRRDVGYEAIIYGPPYDNTFWKPMLKQIKDAGLKIIELDRSDGEAIIYYNNNSNGRKTAKKLAKIANKHGSYLKDETPEEAREIGELLGYDDKDIDAFVKRIYNK